MGQIETMEGLRDGAYIGQDRIRLERAALSEGEEFLVKVGAKDAHGEGIARIGNLVIFVKNGKTRIGNMYKIKLTKIHRTFAYARLVENKRQLIGNGSVLEF